MKKTEPAAAIAVIGGSGLYQMKAISKTREIRVKTPFGAPSGPILLGELGGIACAFLPRHGRGHVLTPGEINGRANIYALKVLGVQRIIAVTAVGSLKEELAPRHFVFPDQLVDRTRHRVSTFFGEGVVAHVSLADPFCAAMSQTLYETAKNLGIIAHRGGAYICMEGPQFSTRAESDFHRKMGYSIIGMTAAPEAKLAREAEICYSCVALVTDYDCWKEGEEVSSQKVIENLLANVDSAQKLIAASIGSIAAVPRRCPCASALAGAIFTAPKSVDRKTAKKLAPLIGKYLKP